MNLTSSKKTPLLPGAALGMLAYIPAYFGNPKNMAICVACFIRDPVGAMKLYTAAVMQYPRPEIVNSVYGSFLIALVTREYRPTAGSSPMLRFILGVIMMVGSLAFLGYPLRMVICMAAGDLNAYVGLIGFAARVSTGIITLKNGFSLGKAYETGKINGAAFPAVLAASSVLSLTTILSAFSERGPGSMHAPALFALAVALLFGAIAQKCRTCFAGSIRDVILMRNFDLIIVVGRLFAAMLVFNLATGGFKPFFAEQPAAYSQHIWDILGLCAVGLATVLAGGCSLRQLVLTDQGPSDSVMTSLGLLVGIAFYHNFGLTVPVAAATTADTLVVPGGLAMTGKAAVIGCIVTLFAIGSVPKSEEGRQEVRDTYGVGIRGSLCSESVTLTAAVSKKHKGESVKVLVSKPHTRMNVEKYAESQGKAATVTEEGSELGIMIG